VRQSHCNKYVRDVSVITVSNFFFFTTSGCILYQ